MDKILETFKKLGRAAFRTSEYATLLGKRGYARIVLHRLKQRGGLMHAKRGWWAFPGALPEAIASDISHPCFVSFHSGLFLHGLTTQTPREVQLAVARYGKSYLLEGIKVREIKIPKNDFNNYDRKLGIPLASAEKAFADSVLKPRTCPEIVLIEAAEKVELARVRKLLHSNAALKRLKRVIKNVGQAGS